MAGSDEGPKDDKPSNANLATSLGQFYRGEVGQSNTWRTRLDTTSNWAVISTGATVSLVFSDANHPHFVILLGSLLLVIFLLMEARRYRYYEIWSSRARVVEVEYFAPLLKYGRAAGTVEQSTLAGDLVQPHFTIGEREAIGRRLRRCYIWLLILLALCWGLKVYVHPQPARDFSEFLGRSAIGVVPGWIVFLNVVGFYAGMLAFALATLRLQEAKGTRVR